METDEDRVETSSLKEKFIKEFSRQPSAQDITTWNLGAVDGKWNTVCQRCESKSLPCSSLSLTVVSCAGCIKDGVESECSRSMKERESRVRRVLHLDADTFQSFSRSCFPDQISSSNRDTLAVQQSSSNSDHAARHLTPTSTTSTPPITHESLLISSERPFTPSHSLGNQSDRIIPKLTVVNGPSTLPMNNSKPGADVPPGFDVVDRAPTVEQEPELAYPSTSFDSNSSGSALVGDETTEMAWKAQIGSATASTLSKHYPTSSSNTNGLRTSPKNSKNSIALKMQLHQKELHIKIEQLEGQLEDAKLKLNDVECKLKDEIVRNTELGQQLEANRRETGDLRRSNARLEEKIEGREKEWNKRAAELEVKVRQGEYELRVARRKHEEKLKEMNKVKTKLEAKVVQLQTTMTEGRKKSEEEHDAAIPTRRSEMERWSVEKKTPEPSIQEQKETLKRVENQQREEMRRDYEYRITQKERESTEEVKSSRQHDYEVQKTYQDTVMQMKRSMDDLKRQIEQLRLSQNQWQEKAEARNVELQHVRKILDGQTRDMNKMEAALAEERRGKRKVTEELRERSREHEKQIDIDLVLISSNMECLIQQFRNICTALADKQASKKAILDTCDHLGWQLVAIADSIADGLKDKSDPTSSKPSDAGHSLSPNQDVAVAAPAVPSRPAVIPIMNTAHSPRQTAPLTSSSPTVVQSEPALAHQSTSPRAEPMISKVPTTSTSPSQSPTRHRRAKQTARKSTGTRPPLSAERSSSTTSEERLNAELELSEEERRVTPALNSIPNAFTSVLATKQRKQTARKSLGSRPSLQSGRSSSTSTFRGRNRRLSLSVSDSEEEGHGTSTLNLTPSVQGSSVSTPASERRRRTMQTARKSLGPRPPLPSERTSSTPASNRREQEAGPSEERRGTPVPNSTPSVQTPSTSTPDTEGRYPTKQTARKRVGGPPYPFFVRKSSVSKRKYKPQLYSSDLELEPPTAPVRSPASSVQGTLASDTVAQQKLIQTARKRLGGRPLLPFKRSSSVTRPPYNRVILPNAPSLRTTVGPPPSRNNPVSLSNDSEQDLRTGPRTERVAPLHPSRELVSPNGESTSGKRLLQSVDEDEELQTRPHKKQRR